MRHCGTRQLDTGRLRLRRFALNDAEAMFKNWASDREVTKYLTWQPHENSGITGGILKNWVKSYADNTFYLWAITLKEESGEPIGSIAAVDLNDDPAMVRIGYCIGKNIGGAASPGKL